MEEQNNGTTNNSRSELWSLSLRDLFYKYVRFLPIFILSVAVALLGAYAYLRYATSIYNTGGTLIIKSENYFLSTTGLFSRLANSQATTKAN